MRETLLPVLQGFAAGLAISLLQGYMAGREARIEAEVRAQRLDAARESCDSLQGKLVIQRDNSIICEGVSSQSWLHSAPKRKM